MIFYKVESGFKLQSENTEERLFLLRLISRDIMLYDYDLEIETSVELRFKDM